MIRLWVWSYTAVNLLTTRNNDLVLELVGRNVADELVDVKCRLQPATERALLLELAKRAGFALVEPGDLNGPASNKHPGQQCRICSAWDDCCPHCYHSRGSTRQG